MCSTTQLAYHLFGVLAISGLGFNLTLVLVDIGGSNLPLLLVLAAAVCIVLGMGLPTLAVYALLAALVAPALVKVGIEPIAAHLYVMYFGMMSMMILSVPGTTCGMTSSWKPVLTGELGASSTTSCRPPAWPCSDRAWA